MKLIRRRSWQGRETRPLLTSSTACGNAAWLSQVLFRILTRHCRKLVIQELSFVLFEAWWSFGFAFTLLLADKPNFCAEKHAKCISFWSVGKSYCGWFCIYGLICFAILLPNDKTMQVSLSDGWHLLGLYPESLCSHSRAIQTRIRSYTEKFPVEELKCCSSSSHKYQVANTKGCFNPQATHSLKLMS